MLAVRSGRYEDVQAMLGLCNVDFSMENQPSAWDLMLLIGDPKMIKIMKEGKEVQQKKEQRKSW